MPKLPHRCEECGDNGSLYLHGRYHPRSATWALLTGDVLTIQCAQCAKVVVRFRVVPEPLTEENSHA